MRAAGPRARPPAASRSRAARGPRTGSPPAALRSRPGSRARRAGRARRRPRTPRAPRVPGRAPGSAAPRRGGGTSRATPRCASSVFATSMSPDVPASSRCTIPGRSGPPHRRERDAHAEQAVHERARAAALGRVRDQPGRLRDHQQVLVLEPDRHRRALRLQRHLVVDHHRPTTRRPRSANDLLRTTPSTVTCPAAIARWMSARVSRSDGRGPRPDDPARRRTAQPASRVGSRSLRRRERREGQHHGARPRSRASARLKTGQTWKSTKSTTCPRTPGRARSGR